MRRRQRTRDETLEAVISGARAPEDLDDLVTLVRAVRLAAIPVDPDDALRSMFDEGIDVEAVPAAAAPAAAGATPTARSLRTRGKHMWDGLTTRLAGLGLTTKIALGSAVAVAGVTGAATLVPEEAQVPSDVPVVVEPASEEELEPPADDNAEDGLETAREAIASGGEDGWGRWVTQDNGGTPDSLPASEEAEDGIATAGEASEGRSTVGLQTAEDAIDDAPPTPPAGPETGEEASGVTPPAGPETGEEASGVTPPADQSTGGERAGAAGTQTDAGADNAEQAERAGERPGR